MLDEIPVLDILDNEIVNISDDEDSDYEPKLVIDPRMMQTVENTYDVSPPGYIPASPTNTLSPVGLVYWDQKKQSNVNSQIIQGGLRKNGNMKACL